MLGMLAKQVFASTRRLREDTSNEVTITVPMTPPYRAADAGGTHRRLRRQIAVIAIAVSMLIGFGPAGLALAHYFYLGNGYWQTTELTYRNYTPSGDWYYEPSEYAIAVWSNNTDVNFTVASPGYEKVAFYQGNFGDTVWYARALICTLAGCPTADRNSQYTYTEVQYNTLKMDNMQTNERRATAVHEVGHTLSLQHATDLGQGVHIMYDDPAWIYRTYGIYYLTQHDIDAVNNRY